MTKYVAISIAAAFGVDPNWLLGQGSETPIPARFGLQQWTKEMADSIEKRKMSKVARSEDAAHCVQWYMINADRLARIITKGFKSKKTMLCLSRVESAMDDLMKQFSVKREFGQIQLH